MDTEEFQQANTPDDSFIQLDEVDKEEAWTFFGDKMSELVNLRDTLGSQQSSADRQETVEQIKSQMPELETNDVNTIAEEVNRELENLVAIIPGVSADVAQEKDIERAAAYLTQKIDTWLGLVNRKESWRGQVTQGQRQAISARRSNSLFNAINAYSILSSINPEAAQSIQPLYSQTAVNYLNNYKTE